MNRNANLTNADQTTPGGIFVFDALSNSIVYICLASAAVESDFDALCMDGFPVPCSARADTLDRTLTKFGVERERFPVMYKTGKDTCAVVALLVHGASVYGSDGAPGIELPVWPAE